MPFKKGKLNPKYKDGRAKEKLCPDCKKKYIDYRNNRCQSCENKRRFKGKTWEEIMGKTKSQILRKLISKVMKGKPKTRKHRKKISEKTKGRVSPFKGKKHTKEAKSKLSLSHGGTGIPHEFSEYGTEFDNALKEQVRFRDNYTCQLCGCSQLENGRQ